MFSAFRMGPAASGRRLCDIDRVQPDQNMMIPEMKNSHEFRLLQVSSYSGQTVIQSVRLIIQSDIKKLGSPGMAKIYRL